MFKSLIYLMFLLTVLIQSAFAASEVKMDNIQENEIKSFSLRKQELVNAIENLQKQKKDLEDQILVLNKRKPKNTFDIKKANENIDSLVEALNVKSQEAEILLKQKNDLENVLEITKQERDYLRIKIDEVMKNVNKSDSNISNDVDKNLVLTQQLAELQEKLNQIQSALYLKEKALKESVDTKLIIEEKLKASEKFSFENQQRIIDLNLRNNELIKERNLYKEKFESNEINLKNNENKTLLIQSSLQESEKTLARLIQEAKLKEAKILELSNYYSKEQGDNKRLNQEFRELLLKNQALSKEVIELNKNKLDLESRVQESLILVNEYKSKNEVSKNK